jgi:putative ABC transport system permease protein
MQNFWQDLRYCARALLKKPGFALTAVLTLALGIGANTAIFSVVNAVLLRPLPYEKPEQLVALNDAMPSIGFPRAGLSEAEFIQLRQNNHSFAEVAAWYWGGGSLRGVGEPERVVAPRASANFLRTLGVRFQLGRDFNPEEELAGKNNVVVLSHNFWQRKFAGDPAVIGRQLTLDDTSLTVIGVLPASFKAPPELQADTHIDMWRGYDLNPSRVRRGSQFLNVIGRLRPAATLAQAQAESTLNTRREAGAHPDYYPADISNLVVPLERSVVGDTRRALLILLVAVAVVLLIACANVANLLLVRGEERQKEIAVRAALGASRGRIIRQMLAESLLLAALGGGLGLLLARWVLEGLLAISPENVPRLMETSLDVRVTGFALLISLATAMIFGLAPALHAVKFDLHTMLKESGRGSGQNSRSRLRRSLIVLETGLAMVLLVAAGLLIRSFWKLQHVDTGFRPDHLLTMALTPPGSAYQDNQQIVSLYERLLGRISTLPGVESAAVVNPLPLDDNSENTVIEIEGRPLDMNRLTNMSTEFRAASSGYFRTLGLRLTRGRLPADTDREGAQPVAVINESFARNHWPTEDPVGKRFRLLDAPPDKATTRFLTIVGVVADVKNQALNAPARQEAYVPLAQHAVTYGRMGAGRTFVLVARTLGDPSSLTNAVQQEARNIEREFIITSVRTMDQLLQAAVVQPRFNMLLLGSFAVLALALGAVGLYGVMAYTVTQRTRELGIRMALGAQRSGLLLMIIKQGMALALSGIALGLLGAWALTRLMANLLFGVGATDPLTFLGIASLLTLVALAACLIPARRATKVDPVTALRYE